MDKLCDYGCNRSAKYTFKSGKTCCESSTSKCPALLDDNRRKIKAIRDARGNAYWKNGHPKGSKGGTSLKGKTYDEIFGPDRANERRAAISSANTGNRSWEYLDQKLKEKLANDQRARIVARYEQGWMPKAGRCKKIRYESPIAGEVLLDGTWELAAAQYMDRQGWQWSRNTKRFPYTNLKGSLSHYTPDFHVEELGGYLEVKGYETDLDRCKWAQFNFPLTIWKKSNILRILERGPDGKAAGC